MLPVPRRAALAALVVAVLAALPATAAQAEPAPFGHPCAPQNGVRFCPTADLSSRVPSFDGTPIDVDVTLPATGDGPFPTILLLHGLGQSKTTFESTADPLYNSWYFAQQGYAVVTPTARGYGNSCGQPESRTAGCEAGWTRLGDMRYEVRDIQTLTGRLVDEGIAKPDAIGATGISYGGGFSTMLAYLKDRIRLPDGGFAPWTSPAGTPISLAAAWPRWLWSNGESIFTRNGRGPWSRMPFGVVAQAYAGTIFAVGGLGFVAPTGGDLSTDITAWKRQLDAGTPGATVQPTLDNAYNFHGVAGIASGSSPSPLLLQSGWTDALFPVTQSLGAYDSLRRQNASAPVTLQVADLGHNPAANHPQDVAAFDRQGLAFFDAWLKGAGTKPAPGSVTAYTMTCPATAPSGGGPYTAASFGALARGTLRFSSPARLRITSKGADAELAAKLSAVGVSGALCTRQRIDRTSRATVGVRSPGVTLIGLPVITGTVATKGRNGQLDARLWDLDPKTHTQRLITRGAYRLTDDQHGRFSFALDGNGWRFAKGHRIVVELLGRDAPTYGPSPTPFTATLTKVKVSLPVRERR